jgi:tetratricopeptide (TPR) repeat protein
MAEDFFNDALQMHNSGNIQEAIRLYSKAIEHDQHCVMAYQMRGAAWQKLYQFRKAIEDYTMVIDLGDPWFQAVGYFNRGVVRTLTGRYDEAIPDFTQAIAIDRKMSAAFLHRGIARIKTGDGNGTFDDFREAALLGDPEAERWLNTAAPGWREKR